MEGRKVGRGLRLREGIFECRPGATMQARDLLSAVSYLSFLHCVVPGGFCHLRSGWNAANESGVMDPRRTGARRASAATAISEDLRNDMAWWRKMLATRPVRRLQFGESGCFARHLRLLNLRQLAMPSGEPSVVRTRPASRDGAPRWGITTSMGGWSKLERREGINWKESWALHRVLETRGTMLAGKLVLARMDNCIAAAYANYGAGRVSQLTALARKIEARDVALGCAAAALHVAGEDNSFADALSRFSIRVRGLRAGASLATPGGGAASLRPGGRGHVGQRGRPQRVGGELPAPLGLGVRGAVAQWPTVAVPLESRWRNWS